MLIASAVAAQHYLLKPNDEAALEAAVAFLTPLRAKSSVLGPAAALAADMSALLLQIRAAGAAGANGASARASAGLDAARGELRAGAARLAALKDGEDPSVAASVHRAHAAYYKLRGPAASFYTSALLFLGATTPAALPIAERRAMAIDVALAALVGEGIFNFGEVAGQPILSALADTPLSWLSDLLRVFQTGDIDSFNALVSQHRESFDAQPALVAASGTLKEKIVLISLMELAARQPANDRSLKFDDVAIETRLPVDQVEWVAMRAMSLGLISGTIDQVAQVLHVNHIKPRVLNIEQIKALRGKIEAWRAKTDSAISFVANAADKDLFQ